MKKKANDLFIRMVRDIFKFLNNKYGFSEPTVKRSHYGIFLTYANKSTGVRISLEERDGGVFVDLIRLVKNQLPEKPIELSKNKEFDVFDFQDLVYLRNPDLKFEYPHIDELVFNPGKEEVMKTVLNQYANALKKYCADVLEGNFSIFSELDKIVKKRKEKKP